MTDESLQRLARDLHDLVANRLALILMHVRSSAARDRGQPNVNELLQPIELAAMAGMRDLRSIIRSLRSREEPTERRASALPLALALELRVWEMRAHGLSVIYTSRGRYQASCHAADEAIERVVHELLTNAFKYGWRRRVLLRVHYGGDRVVLSTTNIRAGQACPGGRTGLRGVEERILALGGQVVIRKVAGVLFHVTVSVPRPEPVLYES